MGEKTLPGAASLRPADLGLQDGAGARVSRRDGSRSGRACLAEPAARPAPSKGMATVTGLLLIITLLLSLGLSFLAAGARLSRRLARRLER